MEPLKKTPPAIQPETENPLMAYARAFRAHEIDGQLIKFTRGKWYLETALIPIGTQLVAVLSRLRIGWVRWSDNVPTDHLMGCAAEGFSPPRRSELGDLDRTLWEPDSKGSPRDPWQFANNLPLVSPKNLSGIYTYSASSRGGLGAIADLIWNHGGNTKQLPVVSLEADSYPHRDRSYGLIDIPVLKIVGTVDAALYLAALNRAAGGVEQPEVAQLAGITPAASPALPARVKYAAEFAPPITEDIKAPAQPFGGFDPSDEIPF